MSKRAKPPAHATALRALYARVPGIACKRLCGDAYCGPIVMTELELAVLTTSTPAPADVEPFGPGTVIIGDGNGSYLGAACPLYDPSADACTAYQDRPLVCRLWGVVAKLRCPHGCRPERVLTDAEVAAMLDEAARLSAAWRRATGKR